MKISLKIIICILTASVAFTSCNTGKNLYTKGNYYEAVLRSVEKLQKNPNNKKALETLTNAYPNALEFYLDQLENQKNSSSNFKNTNAVYNYNKLNNMYEKIQLSPTAKKLIPNPKKYYTEIEKINPRAAEEQYSAGLESLNFGNRENAKKAYYYFLKADEFVKNYKDVNQKIDEAYNLSLLNVITYLQPIQSKFYKLSASIFYDQLESVFNQIEQNEFIRFFTPEEAKNEDLQNPDQILKINFEDFVVGETHTKERVEKMESDTIKIGEITTDRGSKKDVYGTVKAEVTINRMEIISKGLINLTISQNANGNKVLISENIAGQYVWYNEWGFYNGDKRALTSDQIIISKQKRINPIPPQQMFVEFTKPIYNQLQSRLLNYYRNY